MPMIDLAHPRQKNWLVDSMPEQKRRHFLASCESVELEFATVLGETNDRIRHVYFPVDSFISVLTTLDDGSMLEVGIIGNEGMLGMSLILGVDVASQQALVQGGGEALRIGTDDFLRHCGKSGPLHRTFGRYAHVLMSQLALTAACTHHHVVEARLARWLLMTRDRAHSDRFHLTHKLLALMLGVRRVGVTEAANSLLARGLIDYQRGEIIVLDGAGLEKVSCRCYREGNAMYEQGLGRHAADHKKPSRLLSTELSRRKLRSSTRDTK
jgi:CRP-like cAMP-binding protein